MLAIKRYIAKKKEKRNINPIYVYPMFLKNRSLREPKRWCFKKYRSIVWKNIFQINTDLLCKYNLKH